MKKVETVGKSGIVGKAAQFAAEVGYPANCCVIAEGGHEHAIESPAANEHELNVFTAQYPPTTMCYVSKA